MRVSFPMRVVNSIYQSVTAMVADQLETILLVVMVFLLAGFI